MPPEKLEQAIIDFVNYDYDILLATTIIESGIDMPNTNTIIINDAQNFGLSELHQLRGRVGRSNRKAFCYLLTPPRHTFSVDARRRLQAIESFSELGSGIHIAMQDLDIRGAGNLLGAEQSGFIADLGYETYQKILKEAVEELKTTNSATSITEPIRIRNPKSSSRNVPLSPTWKSYSRQTTYHRNPSVSPYIKSSTTWSVKPIYDNFASAWKTVSDAYPTKLWN